MADGVAVNLVGSANAGLLDRARIVAKPGFNRWLVPPAALAIHLCIGMAYGFSVFWLPLTRILGIDKTLAPPADTSVLTMLFTTTYDWRVSDITVLYTLFFVFLGSSAAIWGGWLERVGPRKAAVYATLCWCTGLTISALGIYTHQLWMMWLGSGVLGGIGLGLGYISPVSTLIKWFPDRRGMATGMAIMGFGGGALIGSPLADVLMNNFGNGTASRGVWQTFVALAVIYLVFMMAGAFGYRVPPANWAPEGWTPPAAKGGMISKYNVHLRDAHKTPQFWLIWAVLCLNVSAGIGVLAVASPMLQVMFGGNLIGAAGVKFSALEPGPGAGCRDDRGGVCRAVVAVQHWRAVLLGLDLGQDRAEDDLCDVLCAGGRDVCRVAVCGEYRQRGAVRGLHVRDPVDVWRRLRDGAGLSRRHVRHAVRGRDPWAAADGMVDGGGDRAVGDHADSGDADTGGCAARVGVSDDAVHPGRVPGGWVHLQPADPSGGGEVAHARCGPGAAGGGVDGGRVLRHRAGRVLASGAAGLGRGWPSAFLGGVDHAWEGYRPLQIEGEAAMARIGFIGLGNMGGPMAANLVRAGHAVCGFDLSAAAKDSLVAAGGTGADSVAAAVSGAGVVVTMLPAGPQVRAVLAGVFDAAAPGALLIDSSTIDVATARDMAAAAEGRGFALLDAPVSGGTSGAAAGTLTFMVGGTEAAFARAEPFLRAMGRNIVLAGPPGAGQAAKVCNNLILGISMLGVSEAFALADKLGLPAQALFDISSTSSGQCWSLTSYCPAPGPVPAAPSNRGYQPGFAVDLMLKDLTLAADAVASTGADSVLGGAAKDAYARLSAMGLGGKDFSVAAAALLEGRFKS